MGKHSSKKKMTSALSKKAQHQIWVANESPEPTYDLSECELTEVPEGVFSTCKVLLKEALILHDNKLTSLTDNGNRVENLRGIVILDLHNNRLPQLPHEISHLKQIQVLNLSHNQLTSLPPEIKELVNLQTLNLSDNKLSKLPDEIGSLSSLRSLNISSNKIHKLPKTLHRVRTLESLTMDVELMKYPTRDVCQQGVEYIMRQLCADAGVEYVAPSKVVLPILKGTALSSTINPAIAHLHPDNIQPNLSNYEATRRRKQEQNLLIEREQLENQDRLTSLLIDQQHKKHGHIASLAEDNKVVDVNITRLQMKQESDRQRLYDLILQEDSKATDLINEIIKRNSESQKRDELLQELQDERDRETAQIAVKNEEIALLRKEEMVARMREALEEIKGFDMMIGKYLNSKDQSTKTAQQRMLDEDSALHSKLSTRGAQKRDTVNTMLQEENWQMKALEALMMKRDSRHSQLTDDISSLEKQLARLSIVEMSNKLNNNKAKLDMLQEQRSNLSALLMQLMEQRDLRAKEIARQMVEMEKAREDDLADYWLAQMQRLLDRKPQSQIDRESQLEIAVKDILSMSNADDYISRFAQHKVSIETLKTLTDEDLRRIGVHEVGTRKAIQKNTKIYLEKIGEDTNEEKKLSEAAAIPTAPSSSSTGGSGATISEGPSEVLTHVTTECVICMERQTCIVFLPCGHVCCCLDCSQPLFNCPMCRATITQKIILET